MGDGRGSCAGDFRFDGGHGGGRRVVVWHVEEGGHATADASTTSACQVLLFGLARFTKVHLWVDDARDEVQAFSVEVNFFAAFGFKPAANGHLGDDASLDAEVRKSGAVWEDRHGSSDEKVASSCRHGQTSMYGVHEGVQRRRAVFGRNASQMSSFISRYGPPRRSTA